jgi:hypothetical protein
MTKDISLYFFLFSTLGIICYVIYIFNCAHEFRIACYSVIFEKLIVSYS